MARQILKVLELRRISVREHEQRLRAEALAQEGGRGRLTWQVSPDLLAALNSRGCFQTSNPAWKNMLGWTEPEVASMSIFNLLHGDDVERTRDGFNLTQDSQIVSVGDGSYRWISWFRVPEEGMVYCSGQDITEEMGKLRHRC
jgi:PAS domain S-box-containing protein